MNPNLGIIQNYILHSTFRLEKLNVGLINQGGKCSPPYKVSYMLL